MRVTSCHSLANQMIAPRLVGLASSPLILASAATSPKITGVSRSCVYVRPPVAHVLKSRRIKLVGARRPVACSGSGMKSDVEGLDGNGTGNKVS